MTNFDRIMETPLKKLWPKLTPETLGDMISEGSFDCCDCPFKYICDVDKTDYTCYGFIMDWLQKEYVAN